MPSGDPFSNEQVQAVAHAAAGASSETGLHFSVYIGGVDGDVRDAAEKLHAALGAQAPAGVLIVVSPGDRLLEIVTGKESSRRLSDRACALAALSMTTSFSGGDLIGGIVSGLRMMSESSGRAIATA